MKRLALVVFCGAVLGALVPAAAQEKPKAPAAKPPPPPPAKVYQALFPVKDRYRWGFMDAKGKIVIHAQYHWVFQFSEGMAMVQSRHFKCGYIDEKGRAVIKAQFDGGSTFHEGRAFVNKEGML